MYCKSTTERALETFKRSLHHVWSVLQETKEINNQNCPVGFQEWNKKNYNQKIEENKIHFTLFTADNVACQFV